MSSDQSGQYRAVNQALIAAIPELQATYEREAATWDEELGSHVVYGTMLNPYIDELLQSDEREAESILARIFNFLEELATGQDPYAADVVITTVAEFLEDDPTRLDRARAYMGSEMRRHARTRLPYRVPRRHRQTSPAPEGPDDRHDGGAT